MSGRREAGCVLADWDSAFFGLRIARFDMDRPTAADAERAVAWGKAQALDCLYALVDAPHVPSIRALEHSGFQLADVRLTLDRSVADDQRGSGAWPIDDAGARDTEALLALARTSHLNTRFTEDARFGHARAVELYAAWMSKALAEDDAIVLVPRVDDRPRGYLTLHGVSQPEARVGLVAVAPELQRRGVGQALMHEGLRRLRRAGAKRLIVVTQGRHAAAVRFYEQCGFQTRACQLWYHRWFTP